MRFGFGTSGFISADDLLEILGDDFEGSEIESIIEEVDPNHDGKISYAEFLVLWEEHSEKIEDEFAAEIRKIKIPTNKWDSERSVSVLSSSDLSTTVEDGSPSNEEKQMEIVARANFCQREKVRRSKASSTARNWRSRIWAYWRRFRFQCYYALENYLC